MMLETTRWLELLAESLLHSLWQSALLALFLFLGLKCIPASRTKTRYAMAVGALLSVVVCVGFTFSVLHTLETREPAPAETTHEGTHGVLMEAFPVQETSEITPSVPRTDRVPSPPSQPSWMMWTFFIWAAGSLVGFVRLVRSIVAANGLKGGADPFEAFSLEALVERCGLKTLVPVCVTPKVDVACVIGYLNPIVLLPVSAATMMTQEQLELILAHEFAHLRRLDPMWNLVQCVIEALFFLNPSVWWISHVVRVEREACCDAEAIRNLGKEKEYLGTLLSVAEQSHTIHPAMSPAFSGPESEKGILARAKRLVKPGHAPELRLSWGSRIGSGLVILVVLLTIQVGSMQVTSWALGLERIETVRELSEIYPQAALERIEAPHLSETKESFQVQGTLRSADGTPYVGKTLIWTHSRAGTSSVSSSSHSNGTGTFMASIRKGKGELLLEPENAPAVQIDLGMVDLDRENVDVQFPAGSERVLEFVDADTGVPLKEGKVKLRVQGTHAEGALREKYLSSDANGRVTVARVGGLPFGVQLHAPGYAEAEWKELFLKGEGPLRLEVKPTKPFHLLVRAASDGRPVKGAQLRLSRRIATGRNASYGTYGEVLGVSDEQGKVVATSLDSFGVYYGLVEAPGFQTEMIGPFQSGATAEVSLNPSRTIAVHVEGIPAELTEVDLTFNQELNTPAHSHGVGRETVTVPVEEGSVVYSWTPPIRTSSIIEVNGLSFEYTPQELAEGKVVIRLHKDRRTHFYPSETPVRETGELVLQIQVEEGQPPAEGKVVVEYYRGGYFSDPNYVRSLKKNVITVEQGIGRLQIPFPNRVSARSEGLLGYWFEASHPKDVTTSDNILSLPAVPAGAIFGEVTDAHGRPVGRSFVSVYSADRSSSALGVEVKNSYSSSDDILNRYLASPLPLGKEYVVAIRKDFTFIFSEPIALDEKNLTREVNMVLPKGIDLEGQILFPEGIVPQVPNVTFRVETKEGRFFGNGNIVVSKSGHFSIPKVNPDVLGTTYLEVEDVPGCVPIRFEVDFTKSTQILQMKRGFKLSGRVVDAESGQPMVGAEVYAMRKPHQSEAWLSHFNTSPTDEEGRFEFTNLPKGRFSVHSRSGKVVGSAPSGVAGRGDAVELVIEPYPWVKGVFGDVIEKK